MDAKVGEIFEVNGRKFAFIEMKQTRWVGVDIETGKEYRIKGGKSTGEIHQPTIEQYKVRHIQNAHKQMAVKNMVPGQAFEFRNKKYYYIRANRTRFVFCDAKGSMYNLNMTANIKILSEGITLHECQYCKSRVVFTGDDELCTNCARTFGHKYYSEL